MIKLNTVKIDGKNYPIRCDLNILSLIQDEYENINDFELKLLGVKYQLDDEGERKYAADGSPLIKVSEPDMKALAKALEWMVNEGLDIKAKQESKEFTPIEAWELIASLDISPSDLSKILHDEFSRCFKSKK